MEWVKLLESHPAVLSTLAGFVGVIVGGIVTFLASTYVARLGFRAEVMKLRYSIAERRAKEFDEAAAAFRDLVVALSSRDVDSVRQLREQYLPASHRLALAASPAMMPEHDALLAEMGSAFADACSRLHKLLSSVPGKLSSEEQREYGRSHLVMYSTLRALTQAVDVSMEGKLEGRSSRRHTNRMRAIKRALTASIEEADRSTPPAA